jgi:hypothetical protein
MSPLHTCDDHLPPFSPRRLSDVATWARSSMGAKRAPTLAMVTPLQKLSPWPDSARRLLVVSS